jgi:hypothetical protein
MAIVIKWADEAKKTFNKNINYLLEEWTEKKLEFCKTNSSYIIKNNDST